MTKNDDNGTGHWAALIATLELQHYCNRNPHGYGSHFMLSASGDSCGGLILFLHHYRKPRQGAKWDEVQVGPGVPTKRM